MEREDGCIFCAIARGEAPAATIFDDDLTVAFMDVNPATDGHALVISRAHFPSLHEIEDPHLAAVARSARRVAAAMQRALAPDGIRVNQFNGRAAGQTVFHYHVHLVPVHAGQPVASHGRGPGDPDRIRTIAGKLRRVLEAG